MGAPATDSLHVLRAEPLQLRGIAIGTGEIEPRDIHVRCENRRELATKTRKDVHDTRGNVSRREAFRELDRDERVRLGCDEDRGVAADDDRREARDETEER